MTADPAVDPVWHLLTALPRSRPLIAAVSGGSDSVALLGALGAVAPRLGHRVIVATVDHGLRPEAADEARDVARLAARFGFRHECVRWEEDKPATGIQSAARDARHRLLSQVAGRHDAACVLTGHSQDDQVETLLMRAKRLTAPDLADHGEPRHALARGACGIAPATLHDATTWFLRPLLGVSRAALRDFAVAQGLDWADDPSNDDARFERVRVRRAVSALTAGARSAVLAGGRQAAAWRMAQGDRTARLLDKAVSMPRAGLFTIDMTASDDLAEAELTAYVVALAGGGPHLPGAAALRQLAAFLRSGAQASLAIGRAVVARRGDVVLVHRERRNLHRIDIAPGHAAIWDRRFRIVNHNSALHMQVAPGGPEADASAQPIVRDLPGAPVRGAQWAQPALNYRQSDGGSAGVDVAGATVNAFIALHDTFLPVFDLTVAQAAARLMGRGPYPGLPAGALVDAV